jgi:hypothetical protein
LREDCKGKFGRVVMLLSIAPYVCVYVHTHTQGQIEYIQTEVLTQRDTFHLQNGIVKECFSS